MLAGDGERRRVVSFWRDEDAIDAFEASPRYRTTVAAIDWTGFLRPPQSTERLLVTGGWLDAAVTSGP